MTTPELGLTSAISREEDQTSTVVTLGLPTAEAIMGVYARVLISFVHGLMHDLLQSIGISRFLRQTQLI